MMATCRQSTTYSCNTVNRVILRAHQCTRSIAKMRGLYLSPLLLLGVLAFSGVAPPRCHASESIHSELTTIWRCAPHMLLRFRETVRLSYLTLEFMEERARRSTSGV